MKVVVVVEKYAVMVHNIVPPMLNALYYVTLLNLTM